MSAKRPSIKDVAKAAGVHYSTVSLALREHSRIPEATRKRIADVAKAMGYERSEVSRSLVSFRKGVNVGVRAAPAMVCITNQASRAELVHRPYIRDFFDGAKERAEAMGYGFEEVFLKDDAWEREALEAWLEERRVCGVVLVAMEKPFDEDLLDWSRYSVVKIDSRLIRPRATVVANDQQHAVSLAFRKLRELGYRRIGVAVGEVDHESTHGLYAGGYMLEQRLDGAAEYVPVLYLEKNSCEAGHSKQLVEWIGEHRVDAVLCTWNTTPELLAMGGLRVPEDVAFANLCLNGVDPGRAGVVQNHRRVGQKSAETLARYMKTSEVGAREVPPLIYIEGAWQAGPSAPAVEGGDS